jgi:hypothetical protein
MSKRKLAEMVKEYLENPHHKGSNIPLEEVGIYEIKAPNMVVDYNRNSLGIYRGRYVDIIARAVRMPEFYAKMFDGEPRNRSKDNCSNKNNGYIIRSRLNEVIPVKGLLEELEND